MDDLLDEHKSLDELHGELVAELERLQTEPVENLEFSDANLIIYLLDLYTKGINNKYSSLMNSPKMQILSRLRRNLDDQAKLMDNREDPDPNLWAAAINLADKYLSSQNSHTLI